MSGNVRRLAAFSQSMDQIVNPAAPAGPAEALARLGRSRDAVAWAWLVEQEGPRMFRIAFRLLGDAHAAEDACQEAFLHLREGAGRFQPRGGDADAAARAWLARVTGNAAISFARSEGRRARREQAAAIPVSGPERADPADLERLRCGLAALPEPQRLPLVMHHLGGHDFAAIGAALGISTEAARVRSHRGMERLRGHLARAGVLAAAVGLLKGLAACEAPVPAGAPLAWNALLVSSTQPAAASAAIFGGLSIMAKLTLTGAGIAAIALITCLAVPGAAEEKPRSADPPRNEHQGERRENQAGIHQPARSEPRKEGADAMPAGTKGVGYGTIVSLEKGKLILRPRDPAEGDTLFMPHWRGGMPKDGGGFDKEMLRKLEVFKVGDTVRIEWVWEERRRIEAITKVGVQAEPGTAPQKNF